jgi:hypothetical protein
MKYTANTNCTKGINRCGLFWRGSPFQHQRIQKPFKVIKYNCMHTHFNASIEIEIRYRIAYFGCIFITFMLEISVDIHAKIILMILVTIFDCDRNKL